MTTNNDQAGNGNPNNHSNPDQGAEEVKKLKDQVQELTSKLETVTRQYNGSTSEALRLKKELEDVQDALQSAEGKLRTSKDQESFQKLWENDQASAVQHIVQESVKPLMDKVDALFQDKAEQVFNSFKAKHPGLTGDVLNQFNEKLKTLKPVYTDLVTAMNDAFRLVGGDTADQKARQDADEAEKARRAQQQSQIEGAQIVAQAGVSESGDRNSSASRASDAVSQVEQELEALRSQSAVNSLAGTDDLHILVRIQELERKLEELKKK